MKPRSAIEKLAVAIDLGLDSITARQLLFRTPALSLRAIDHQEAPAYPARWLEAQQAHNAAVAATFN